MTVKEAFTRSFELYEQGIVHKIFKINGKWVIIKGAKQ